MHHIVLHLIFERHCTTPKGQRSTRLGLTAQKGVIGTTSLLYDDKGNPGSYCKTCTAEVNACRILDKTSVVKIQNVHVRPQHCCSL